MIIDISQEAIICTAVLALILWYMDTRKPNMEKRRMAHHRKVQKVAHVTDDAQCISFTLAGVRCKNDTYGVWTVCNAHMKYFLRHNRLPPGGTHAPCIKSAPTQGSVSARSTCGNPHKAPMQVAEIWEDARPDSDSESTSSTVSANVIIL